MARKKDSLGFYPVSPDLGEVDPKHLDRFKEILGEDLPEDFFQSLFGELDGWLLRFGVFAELRYGRKERRLVRSVQRSAEALMSDLETLGDVGKIILEKYGYRHGVSHGRFLSVLSDIQKSADYLDHMAGPEINAAAIQVHAIKDVLEAYGIRVTVRHDTRGLPFRPSSFTRLVDLVWQWDSRLRVYDPKTWDYWPNLSQWLSARLREEPRAEQLKLVRRPRLE